MAKNKETVDVNVMDQNVEEIVNETEPKTKWYKTRGAKIAGAAVGVGAVAGMAIKQLIFKRHENDRNCIIDTWDGDDRETVFADDVETETE